MSARKKKPAPARLPQLLAASIAAHHAGQWAEAEHGYREILSHAPSHPDALHNLGMLYQHTGQAAKTLPLLKQALEAKPTQAQFWLSYGGALLASGFAPEAQSILDQGAQKGLHGPAFDALYAQTLAAIKTTPDWGALQALETQGNWVELERLVRGYMAHANHHPKLLHGLGLALYGQRQNLTEAQACLAEACRQVPQEANWRNHHALILNALQRYEEAHAQWLTALELRPNDPDVLINMGDNLNDAGRYSEALSWLEQAYRLQPDSVPARLNLANALIGLTREDEALPLLEALLNQGVRIPEVLHSYSLVLRLAQRSSEALPILRELLTLQPNHAEGMVGMGHLLVDEGQFDEAGVLFRRALEIKPELPMAWSALPSLGKMTPADAPWLETAGRLVVQSNLAPRTASGLYYAMGKFCDDVKNYDEAFDYYRQANERKKSFNPPYHPDKRTRLVDHLIATYTPDVVQNLRQGASDSQRPLFIVGMPRSGTSLTEQIIASHPATFGAGELTFWGDAAQTHRLAMLNADYPAELLRSLVKQYLALLEQHSQDAVRVVDKMPGNINWIGLINAAFPQAKILHTVRNPIDTCLSIYFQNFNATHKYANDLSDLAHYYREYHRLAAHWRAVMPKDRFLELPYEQLVEDQEGWSRKIIEFIGLPWDERCLAFYKTERKVGTASNWQAKQPIYKTSKERWRNYERYVGPLLPLHELYDPERGHI